MIKHRYSVALLALTFAHLLSYSQQKEQISLEQLQAMAKENYPLLKQKQMYSDIATNKVKQLNSNFLPQATITGQVTYQSEVAEFNFPDIVF